MLDILGRTRFSALISCAGPAMRPAREIVIGLDSSTTATKAIAWRPDGSLAGEGRSPVPLSSPAPDRYEQDPEDWWRSACQALRELLQQVDPDAVAAIAISNQRETFAPLAAGRSACAPGHRLAGPTLR